MPHFEELHAQVNSPPPVFESTGVLSGGALSINAGDNTKFDMAEGIYAFADYTYNPSGPARSVFVKEAVTAQTVTNIATQLVTFIGVDSDGNIIQNSAPFTNAERRTIAQVGVLVHTNLTNLNAINDTAAPVREGISQLHDFMTAVGPMNIVGNVVGANGANLNVNKSAGQIFKLGASFQATPLSPHLIATAALIAPANMRYRLSDSTEFANTAVLDPTQYESSPGVLSTLSNPNKFSVQRVALFTSNLIRIQYGQDEYDTMTEAEAAISTQAFTTEENIAENGVLIAFVVIKRSTTDLTNTSDVKFIAVGKFGASAGSVSPLTSTDDLPEGVVNLYFTDARARAAVVTASITNGDTTHSPSGDAVFDALALKADLAGATFSGPVQINSTLGVTGLSTLATMLNSGAALQATKSVTTSFTPQWQMHGSGVTAAVGSGEGWFRWSNDANAPNNVFSKSRGTTVGSHVIVNDADIVARLGFNASDGVAFFETARIQVNVSGTPAVGSVPGAMTFLTTQPGNSSASLALTLNNDQSASFAGHVNAPTTLVVGNTAAIPANTRVLIDRIGTGTLPVLPGGAALTLQGNNASTNNNYLVNIAGATGTAGIRFGDSASANQGRIDYDNATDSFAFFTNATSALTISSAGVVSVGGAFNAASGAFNTTTLRSFASGGASVVPVIQANGTSVATSSVGAAVWSGTPNPATLALGYSAGAAVGTHTIVANTNVLGRISFDGSDGTAFIEAARIEAFVNGTPGTNDMPGGLRFYTTPDGSATPGVALTIGQDKAATFAAGIDLAGLLTGANVAGTYTPTLTGVTNVSATSNNLSGWIRIGNAVIVFTRISVTATASGALTELRCSLPVASNFSATSQCVGSGGIVASGTDVAVVGVQADTTNDEATIRFVSTSVAARIYSVFFAYFVI